MKIRYLSLFSGIGGFEVGMEKSKHNFKCVSFSEIDKYGLSIYTRHFPRHRAIGDVTRVNAEELEDFELLVAGFPCQAFSLAGNRRGFADTRGTLFFEIARILAYKQPAHFLLENVKGLLSHNCGRTFQRILAIINELGYDAQWEVHNSCNYGVPQHRQRLFIKGYSRTKCGSEILHQSREIEENAQGIGERFPKPINKNTQAQTIYSVDGVIPSCCATDYKNHIKIMEGLKLNNATEKGYDVARIGDGVRLAHPSSKSARGRVQKGMVGTLACDNDWGVVTEEYSVRRLTPIECERLQGFEDDWTKWGKDGEIISDTQRYKCLGNAVTVPVIEHIFNNWDLKGN